MAEALFKRKKIEGYEKVEKFLQYAINSHREVNHMYDEYLPYEFHLRMVLENGKKFLYLLPEDIWVDILNGCSGHDLMEDTRENYNAVKKNASSYTAEIIRACTNYGRGRNRKERMPDFVYQDIFETPGATFVKLCDRIANVQYGKLTGSSMVKTYQEEHEHFKGKLYSSQMGLDDMWNYLEDLFKAS